MVKFTKAALRVAFLSLLMVLPLWAGAQEGPLFKVTGKVTDNAGEPVIGASVVVVGTTRGVSTDLLGAYTIEVRRGESLRFSYLGMTDQTIAVHAQKTIDVTLQSEALNVEQVVVVGYGVQKKESVVGAITQVKGERLQSTGGMTSLSSALNGLVPGLTALSSSGKPGEEEAQILIRGMSSWTSSAPLILVDGIERRMEDVDVNEIESMSVLKDASATAVYGVRGGNGVILITTKRGVEGKMSLNVYAHTTLKTISKIPTLLSSYEGRVARNFAVENALGAKPELWSYITTMNELKKFRSGSDPYLYPNVDWQSETLKKFAWSHKAGVDISGGTKFVKYYGFLSYLYDGDILRGRDFGQGYVPKNDFQRINVRSNFDFQITPSTVVSADIDVVVGQERTVGANATTLWKGVWRKAPDEYPVRYEDGTFGNDKAKTDTENTVEVLNYSGQNVEVRTDANASLKLKQNLGMLVKGLSLNAIANFRNYYTSTGPNISGDRALTKYVDPRTGAVTWNYPGTYNSATHGFDYYPNQVKVSTSTADKQVYQDQLYQVSLNFKRTFGEGHDVTGLLLFKRQQYAKGSAFASYREEWAARVTYGFKNRYLFEANGAYNGSEKFGPGNKFGFFPSVAGGWVISNEKFFREHVKFVDFLKVRYSWGIVGSDEGIAKWLYSTQWAKKNNEGVFGYPIGQAPNFSSAEVKVIGNPDAQWETAYKNDVALETTLFNGMWKLGFDYYWGRRTNIFISGDQRAVPPWFGASAVSANIGETKNSGWELETTVRGNIGTDWSYQVGGSVSYAKNEVVFREDPELAPDYQKKAGKPINQPTGIPGTGIIQSWDDIYTHVGVDNMTGYVPGNYALLDYNGDGVVDGQDNVPCDYNHYPLYSFSLNLFVGWKNLSLSALLVGQTDVSRQNTYEEFPSPSYSTAIDRDTWENMWIPGYNDSGSIRHISFMNSNRSLYASQLQRADGTLWRLQSAELSYTFNGPKLKKTGIQSIRLYLAGNNLWLYSHMSDDPEANATRAKESHSAQYPKLKRYTFGVNIKF